MMQSKLENAISTFIFSHGWKDISLIIMHPKTWADLIKEADINVCRLTIYRYDSELKYKGIRVVRSSDMEEGSFEFCSNP